ncbi:hypothetical protein [Chimaeribacter arupi]|uniref:Uncharacterized protein n=1 Tax=Chimaeribacter arupi TaxID=2060066 RepID=A0A2N5EJ29_9GAMM|nr:hypothetical protein [Chimaeribacter arupi]PLR45419.1 hypothetical protein CYR34_17595 [Chimaeribacter arupi]
MNPILSALISLIIKGLAPTIIAYLFKKKNDDGLKKFEEFSWDKKILAISRFNELFYKKRNELDELESKFIANFLLHKEDINFCHSILVHTSYGNSTKIEDVLKAVRNHSGLIKTNDNGICYLVKRKVITSYLLLAALVVVMGIVLPLHLMYLWEGFMTIYPNVTFLKEYEAIKYASWAFLIYITWFSINEIFRYRLFFKIIEKANTITSFRLLKDGLSFLKFNYD